MLRVCIKPTTFNILPIQDKQNKYIDITHTVNRKKVLDQHRQLEKTYKNCITYELENPYHSLPDIVFIANGGLCLPRLPKPLILLPSMKYKQRREELEYLKGIYKDLKLDTIEFPGDASCPFEGQAELKWFHGGTKAVCGYGHRSTKKTFTIADKLFHTLYKKHGLEPPELLVLPLKSEDYYHLDVGMLEFDDTKCIIHKKAFSADSTQRLKEFLGPENVYILDTPDSFCLNAVVDGKNLITHSLTKTLKKQLEGITHKKIIEIDTSEFEKSGGSVRCMTFDVFT
jgi:hypothetical protein